VWRLLTSVYFVGDLDIITFVRIVMLYSLGVCSLQFSSLL